MKILIVDEVHLALNEELQRNGYTVDYFPDYSYQQTVDVISEYHGLVVRSKFFVDKDLIEKGVKLKFLARAGVGLDIFDEEAAKVKNITIINAAGANANSVAEHVVGMLFSLFHNINKASYQVKKFEWKREENRGEELEGKIVGMIGYGNVGQSLAKKLKAFSCTVLAYDKYKINFSDEYVKEVGMDEIFNSSDILTLHIPLTDETDSLCSYDFFKKFKKPIYFLNTARGKIVDTKDLLLAINNGIVKGAGLDVIENEQIPDVEITLKQTYEELFQKDNVILSPHVAGWSHQSFEKISKTLAEKIISLTD